MGYSSLIANLEKRGITPIIKSVGKNGKRVIFTQGRNTVDMTFKSGALEEWVKTGTSSSGVKTKVTGIISGCPYTQRGQVTTVKKYPIAGMSTPSETIRIFKSPVQLDYARYSYNSLLPDLHREVFVSNLTRGYGKKGCMFENDKFVKHFNVIG